MNPKIAGDPTGLVVRGNNWFHDGWISGLLGLPPRDFLKEGDHDHLIRDIDIDSWKLGYETAIESWLEATDVCRRMLAAGQIIVEPRDLWGLS